MDARVRADGRMIFDDDVSGERGGIRHDDVVANDAIVGHMHPGHQKVVIPNPRAPAASAGSSMDVDVFAKDVMGTDYQERFLARELQILRLCSDHAKRKEAIAGSDSRRAF